MLRSQIEQLTTFVAGEIKLLRARSSELDNTLSYLLERGSPLDAEIPAFERNDIVVAEKMREVITRAWGENKPGPDRKLLNFAAYYLTKPDLNLILLALHSLE